MMIFQRHTILACALGAMAFGAHAATTGGEADESGSRAVPAAKTTKEERAKARTDRLRQTAQENKAGEIARGGEADPSGSRAMGAAPATKAERAAARQERLRKTAEQNKRGEIPMGEQSE